MRFVAPSRSRNSSRVIHARRRTISIGFFTFCKRVWQQLGEDSVFTWGSALAYSWLFAIFPFLVFLLSLVPLIPKQYRQNVKPQVSDWIDRTVPSQAAAQIIKDQALPILDKPKSTGFLSFGIILAIWGASGGMSMTITALDRAYDIEKSRSFVRHRLLSIVLTGIVATMVIAVLILLPVGGGVMAWIARHAVDLHIPFSQALFVLVDVARYSMALLLMLAITATIYHFGPNLKHKFEAITPGAIFSIFVWLMLGAAFRVYINKFGGAETYNKTYGAVAGLVILLLFFYIDALVLLVGAEINSEIDFAIAGIPSGPTPEEQKVAPIPTPEAQALAMELQDKRSDEKKEMEQMSKS